MEFREKDPADVAADALRMAERKQAEGCAPCAEAYRQLARDPSRRRLLGRALLGAGALGVVSLFDGGGVLAAPHAESSSKAGATPLDGATTRRLANAARGRADVQALEARIRPTPNVDAFELRDDAGAAVGTVTFLGQDGSVISVISDFRGNQRVIALHDGQVLRFDGGVVVVDGGLTEHVHQLQREATATSALEAVRQAIGARAALSACPTCAGWVATCAFMISCCAAGNPFCCTLAPGACAAMILCCFNQ